MALWKDPAPSPTPAPSNLGSMPRPAPESPTATAPNITTAAASARPKERIEAKESLIASGLAIEGKISGLGHVRIAGQFKGDVHVEGNLNIEPGAKHHGEVRAGSVTVSGELTGNIGAKHIDVTSTGVIVGDVKADTITVASGSRMRGHVEFGWGDGTTPPARSDPSRTDIKGNGSLA